MTKGIIETKVTNKSDGTPLLELRAVDKDGRKFLTKLEEKLRIAQLIAIPSGKADVDDVCWGDGDGDNRSDLIISLALGGIGLRRYPKSRKDGRGRERRLAY